MVEEFVERGFGRAPGEQHIVDQHDGGAGDVDRDFGGRKFLGNGVAPDVVAMERDVDDALGRARQQGRQPMGEGDAAVGDAQQNRRTPRVTAGNGRGQVLDRWMDLGRTDAVR